MNRAQRDLIVLAAGISVGVGLGMLLAPRSGRGGAGVVANHRQPGG